MNKQEEKIKMKSDILIFISDFTGSYVPRQFLNQLFENKYQEIYIATNELEEEGIIKYKNSDSKDILHLTSKGERIVETGCQTYLKDLTEKEKKLLEIEEIQKEKVFIDFKNAKRTKIKDYVSIIMSGMALIISIISLIHTLKK
jgi:DNA-binding PadR family transcriptional regulator